MTDNQSYEEYFEKFRRKQKALADINTRIREMKDEYQQRLNVMIKTRESHKAELSKMKDVIATMVELGCDATEAQLRGTEGRLDIWDNPLSISLSDQLSLEDPMDRTDIYSISTINNGKLTISSIADISYSDGTYGDQSYDFDAAGPPTELCNQSK